MPHDVDNGTKTADAPVIAVHVILSIVVILGSHFYRCGFCYTEYNGGAENNTVLGKIVNLVLYEHP